MRCGCNLKVLTVKHILRIWWKSLCDYPTVNAQDLADVLFTRISADDVYTSSAEIQVNKTSMYLQYFCFVYQLQVDNTEAGKRNKNIVNALNSGTFLGFVSGKYVPYNKSHEWWQGQGVGDIHSYFVYLLGHITVTSQWARCRLKTPASPLFTQPFIQAQIKENIKAPRP